MKTGGFKSTSFAGLTSWRDFRRSFPSSLINIFRGNLARPTRLLFLNGSEIDRRVAGAPDNRSPRTSRSRRVLALGNLSAPVNCSGCNLSLSLGPGWRARLYTNLRLRVREASQTSPSYAAAMLKLGLVCFQLPMSAELVAHEGGGLRCLISRWSWTSPLFRPDLMRLVVTRGLLRANLNTNERTQETTNEICG